MHVEESICVPVFGNTPAAFLETFTCLAPDYSFVELRVDSLAQFNFADIASISNAWKKRAILTCRLQEDGGQYEQCLSQRNSILQQCFGLGVTYVDIELAQAQAAEFDFSAVQEKLLLSHHDFNGTPTRAALEELLDKMQAHSPAVCKIATQVRTDADCRTLYSLLCSERAAATKMIVIGMGPRGRATRILAPFLGSIASFSEPVGAVAPRTLGQFSAKRMRDIFATFS